MPQYFGDANQKEIRQYAEIIAMTDDVFDTPQPEGVGILNSSTDL